MAYNSFLSAVSGSPAHDPRMAEEASAVMPACPSWTSEVGQNRKSRPTFLMSALPPKAEVAIHGADVRYVPIGDIGACRAITPQAG